MTPRSTRLGLREYIVYCRNEMSWDLRIGFAQLALFYGLINNTVRRALPPLPPSLFRVAAWVTRSLADTTLRSSCCTSLPTQALFS